MAFQVPNKFRMTTGPQGSTNDYGNNGAFRITSLRRDIKKPIFCIASDGEGWEHVSVTVGGRDAVRSPTWEEMAFIKGLFWSAEDCVMQLHPPESEYVNNHAYCLHLWRPENGLIPIPDSELVGIKGLTHEDIKALQILR